MEHSRSRSSQRIDPPFVKRPNIELKFESIVQLTTDGNGENHQRLSNMAATTTTSLSSSNSISSTNVLTRERELDEETGKRILKLIYKRRKERESINVGRVAESATRKNTNNNNTTTTNNKNYSSYGPSGHSETFYIPSNDKSSGSGGSRGVAGIGEALGDMVDSATDYFGVKTKSNVLRIDKTMLIDEGITIAMLIEDCRVPLSEMKLAKILDTFRDLLDLGFVPEDLTRNRELLNCSTLVIMYGGIGHESGRNETPCKLLERNGVQFDIRHILLGKFLPSDLMSMGYNLSQPIKNGEITSYQLRALNFTLDDLVSLGLDRSHLIDMDISERAALSKQPHGFGWSRDSYSALMTTYGK